MRGGDVKDGEYVYAVQRDMAGIIYSFGPNVVYRHLDTAKEAVRRIYDNLQAQKPIGRLTLLPNTTFKNISAFMGTDEVMLYARLVSGQGANQNIQLIRISRWKLSEETPNSMKPEQRTALNQLGKKKDLPDDVEGIIGNFANLQQ